MAKQPRHASKGLLILGGHDFSNMTSAAGQNISRAYSGAPAFQKDDVEGIPGPRSSQLEVAGYFIKRELGEVEAALQREIGTAASNLLTLYAPYGPAGTASIGEDCWIQNTHQILTEKGGNIGGIVMLGQTYVANGGSRLAKILHVHTGDTSVGTAEVQTLVYSNAPTVQQFALRATGGDDVFVFTPATSNANLKAGIEDLSEFNGFTVTVTGTLTGTDAMSGTLTLTFAGEGNVPQLEALASESQKLTLTVAATNGTWGTAGVSMEDSEATVQASLRALGGLQQQVVVKGSSTTVVGIESVSVSGAGNPAFNGDYVANGSVNGAPQFRHEDTEVFAFLAWDTTTSRWRLTTAADNGGTVAYYVEGGTTGSIPSAGWVADSGAAPAPTVTSTTTGGGSYTAYWPYSVGNRSQLAVTGSGFTGSTVTQGGEDADTLIVEATSTPGVTSRTYTVRSADFNGTSVDLGRSRSRGARAHLHAVYKAGGSESLIVKIQHSSDDSTWVDLITFDEQTALGAQVKTLADGVMVERYVRAIVASGAITGDWAFSVAFSPWA